MNTQLDTDILNATGVADLVQCNSETVEDLARRGALPGVKLGRSWAFPRQALLETLNEMAKQNLKPNRAPQPSTAPALNPTLTARASMPATRRGRRRTAPPSLSPAPSP